MSESKSYTRLTAEVYYEDGEKLTRVVEVNDAELDIFQMGDLVQALLLALTFHPNSVDELFKGMEQLNYSFNEDVVELEEESEVTTEKVWPLACIDCNECCEDTACLEEDIDW